MPGSLSTNASKQESRKRKRSETTEKPEKSSTKGKRDSSSQAVTKRPTSPNSTQQFPALVSGRLTSQEDILELEEAIIESQKNYNGIVLLLECLQCFEDQELAITSAVSLCRTFCRLMAKGRMVKRKTNTMSKPEVTIIQWLKERYKDYVKELGKLIGNEESSVQITTLTLSMRLLKEEGMHLRSPTDEHYFPHTLMARIAEAVLYVDSMQNTTLRDEFIEKYLDKYHDIRHSFISAAIALAEEARFKQNLLIFRANLLAILLEMKNLPMQEEDYELSDFYVIEKSAVKKAKKQKQGAQPSIISVTAHRRNLQNCWLAVMKLDMEKEQSKSVLEVMTHKIVPVFAQPQLLMDFLTDCYDAGGPLSLLALNGLFQLMKSHNLDYPNFFPKLYALFDRNLMHVRYRSRFFRMVDTFLASTHLPAALVASFIKRMSRLCLSAPPAAIVIVIPFIYNLLKRHPSCTFMVHRAGHDKEKLRRTGMDDPFDEEEEDPMKTEALESSLWEIETLQSHHHPNVATLAKIISEQFTKHNYNLEDFLDHSYATMIDAELSQPLKKDPVVEYEIPKRIFTADPTANKDSLTQDMNQVSVLTQLWDFA